MAWNIALSGLQSLPETLWQHLPLFSLHWIIQGFFHIFSWKHPLVHICCVCLALWICATILTHSKQLTLRRRLLKSARCCENVTLWAKTLFFKCCKMCPLLKVSKTLEVMRLRNGRNNGKTRHVSTFAQQHLAQSLSEADESLQWWLTESWRWVTFAVTYVGLSSPSRCDLWHWDSITMTQWNYNWHGVNTTQHIY